MFEKLFLLVKNNAEKAVVANPAIHEKDRESVINEASSSIIEGLKAYIESGKLNEIVDYFRFPEIYKGSLITKITNKFANKLTQFYNINSDVARATANMLIPQVMLELVKQSGNGENQEFVLSTFLTKINGGRADLSGLVHQMMVA